MKILKYILISFLIVIAGCANNKLKQSGIMPIGPDTYRVAVSVYNMYLMKGQEAALNQARNHCVSIGLEFMIVGTSSKNTGVGDILYEVTYRCLAKGDPDLIRPTPVRAPDISVEVKK